MLVSDVVLELSDSVEPLFAVSVVTEILFLIVMHFPYVLRQCIASGERTATVRVLALEWSVARVLTHVVAHLILVEELLLTPYSEQ